MKLDHHALVDSAPGAEAPAEDEDAPAEDAPGA